MGKVLVAQMPQDVPGSSSREVFQGLFKDLGMQAMALEAILRAVCGRVDKLENWLTEVSFGMTELDLKLRNIAHNIDGTAAVDDETQGPLRWAIPSSDDVKPLAPTVSKKLGADKKAVRVTGMAAAILDRLATNSPTPVEDEKVEKNGMKKKSKDKKHGAKKVKANGLPDVPVTPSPTIVEKAPPPATPLPARMAETKQASMAKTEHEQVPVGRAEASKENEVLSTTFDEVPAPLEQGKNFMTDSTELGADIKVLEMPPQHVLPKNEQTENTMHSNPQPENSSSMKTPAMLPTETTKREVPKKVPVVSSLFPTVQVERAVEPFVLKGTAHTTPVVVPPPNINPVPTVNIPDPLPPQPVPPVEPSTPSVTKPEVEASEVHTSDSEPDVTSVSNDDAVAEEQNLTRPATPPSIASQPSIKLTEPQPAQSLAVTPSLVPVPSTTSTPLKSPISKPSDNMPVDLNGESTPTVLQHQSPLVTEPKVGTTPEPAVVPNKILKAVGMPIRAPQSSQQNKPVSSHDPDAVEPATDPLLPHRTSARRRSSKMAPRPSFSKKIDHGNESDAAGRSSGNVRGSHSRRPSITLSAPVIESESQQSVEESTQQPELQPEPQPIPSIQSIPQASPPPPESPPINTIPQVDVNEESGESVSESSSDESDGSEASSDGEHEDDAEAGAAVDEISKTMIALKKLKRAHMLSPEEEVELKERAHKKWFQLKGHIKEKQKKDVTNILLKRKKNVFTVSSRIELLEEKSREIFAALKQITTDVREKNDRTAHETLRRRVFDIEQSLLNVDSRIASLSAPATEKVSDLESEVASLRTTVELQLTTAQTEATARHSLLEEALVSQRGLVEALAKEIPTQLSVQAELFSEKLKQLPDYHTAIENLKRSLRRKADLKLLKELEARLLGLDAENEDCLVRCLSCHKEVTHPYSEVDTHDEQESSGSQLRKVNPGPSSARIYRSNVPFNAQLQESILEESSDETLFSPYQALMQPQIYIPSTQETQLFQHQSAGDSFPSEKPPGIRVPSVKWSTPPVELSLKKIIKPPQAAPLSLMNVTATRAILSPDRPISAPVIAIKKKANGAARSKSLLKALSPQPEPPQ